MVRLDIGAQANARTDGQSAQSGNGGLDDSPGEESLDRFRRALAGGSADGESMAASQSRAEARHASHLSQAPGAFGLFGSVMHAPLPPMPPAQNTRADDSAAANATARLADEVADRILISADDGREARIAVRNDVMPGVEVRITQEQGRWVVAFIVSDAGSFEVLENAGQTIADQLANRLRSGVEVKLIDASEPNGTPANTFFADPAQSDGVSQ
jgi:hypothetical protein